MPISLDRASKIFTRIGSQELRFKNADSDEIFEAFSAFVRWESHLIEKRVDDTLNRDTTPYFSPGISIDEAVSELFNGVVIELIAKKDESIDRFVEHDEQSSLDNAVEPYTYAIIQKMENYILRLGSASYKEKAEFIQKLDLPKYEAETQQMFDELLVTLRDKVESYLNPPSQGMSA